MSSKILNRSLLLSAFFLVVLFVVLFIYKDYKSNNSYKSKEVSKDLNNCFDFENKNQRSIKESNELMEYCLNKFGFWLTIF